MLNYLKKTNLEKSYFLLLFFVFFYLAFYSVIDQFNKRNIIENINNNIFISFSKKYDTPNEFPEFIEEITNISNNESWGRWAVLNSNSSDIKIIFKKALPRNFKIELQMIGFDQNIDRPASIIISGQKQVFFPNTDRNKIYYFDFNGIDYGTKTIAIRPYKYISPKDLNVDSNDSRKISVGLISIRLTKAK